MLKKLITIVLAINLSLFPTIIQVDSSKTRSGAYHVDFSSMRYVAFGDSITFGSDSSRPSYQMDEPYPKLVGDNLGFKQVDNQGICGATFCFNDKGSYCMTDNILTYTKEADIISVMLGVNDFSIKSPLGDRNDQTNHTIYGCLNLIASYLTINYKDSFIFFMTPYKSAYVKDGDYLLMDISNAIKQVALKNNIPVLDMFNYGNYEREMYLEYSDGLHPTQNFVRRYTSPQITSFIRNNYKKYSA